MELIIGGIVGGLVWLVFLAVITVSDLRFENRILKKRVSALEEARVRDWSFK